MDRHTPYRDGQLFPVPVAAATELFGGHLIAVSATGYAVPASALATLIVMGVCDGWVDNRQGADGDTVVLVRRDNAWFLANSTADPVTQSAVGRTCYVVDSQTVAATDGGTRPPAGRVLGIESGGVWVLI